LWFSLAIVETKNPPKKPERGNEGSRPVIPDPEQDNDRWQPNQSTWTTPGHHPE